MAMMSEPSPKETRLSASFKKWMAKGTSGEWPLQQALTSTTWKVLGLEGLMEQEDEYQELVDRLAHLNEEVLDRIPPNAAMSATAAKQTEALKTIVTEIENSVELQKRMPLHVRANLNQSESRRRLRSKLDSVTIMLTHLWLENASGRIERLEDIARLPLSPTSPTRTLPEIPPKPSIFCGRDDLVNRIVQLLLQPTACHIPLLGPGGIGKTAVAAAVMNDPLVKGKFRFRIIFVSCEGIISAEGIIQALMAALGLQTDSNARQMVLANLEERGTSLLVLDNLETAWASGDQINVEHLLAKLAGIDTLSLIITMRGAIRPCGIQWAETCSEPLGTLHISAAHQMWRGIAHREGPGLDELLGLLDGLPLAIHLLARQGQVMNPEELLNGYRAKKTALMKNGFGPLANLDASIQLSWDSPLMSDSPNARALLPLLCLLPDGIPIHSLPQLFPSMSDTQSTAIILLEAALALKEPTGRLRVLSPIRDFILCHYPPSGSWLHELRTYVQNLTRKMQTSKIGTTEGKQAVNLLTTEFGNINSVLLHFWKAPPHDSEIRDLLAATGQLATFSHLASCGDCTQLVMEARLRLEEMGYAQGAAECAQRLGDILSSHDRYDEAIESFKGAMRMFDLTGNFLAAARCIRSIGDLLRMRNRYPEAIAHLEDAQVVFDRRGDVLGAAQCTQSLGDVLRMMGYYKGAIQKLEQARGYLSRITNRSEYDEANERLEMAKDTFDDIRHRLGAAQCARSQGDALRMLRRYPEAITKLEEARVVFTEIGNRLGAAQCNLVIGNVLRMQGRFEEFLERLEAARAMFRVIRDRLGVAECNKSLPSILIKMDRIDEASSILQEALSIYQDLGLDAFAVSISPTAPIFKGIAEDNGISSVVHAVADSHSLETSLIRGSSFYRSDRCTKWKTRTSSSINPMKDNVERMTLSVLGIWDLVDNHQKDCQELAGRLTLISEQVLKRTYTETDQEDNEQIRRLIEALREVVPEVETYLRKQRGVRGALAKQTSAEAGNALHKRLDGLMLEFAVRAEKTALLARGGPEGRLTRLDVSIQLSLSSHSVCANPAALHLLSLVCLLPDGVPVRDLAQILSSMKNTRQTALVLLQAAFIVRPEPGLRIKALSPIRDFILLRYPPSGPALEEVRHHFMALASQAAKLGSHDSRHVVDSISAQFGNINAVLLHAWRSAPEKEPQRNELLQATEHLAQFSHVASYGDCMPLLGEAVAFLDKTGNLRGAGLCRKLMGHLLGRQDRYPEMFKVLDGAIAAFLDVDDQLGVAQCTYTVGGVLLMLRRYSEAVVKLKKAKTTFEAVGNRHGAAQCTRSMGDVLRMLGRFEKSIVELQSAKATLNELGDRLWVAQCTRSLGDVFRMQEQFEQAVIFLEEARVEYESVGNRLGAAQCVRMIGDALRMQRHYDKALTTLEEANLEYDAIGNRMGAAQCMLSIGEVHFMTQTYDAARATLEEANSRFVTIGYRFGIAESSRLLSRVYFAPDHKAEAKLLLQEALQIFEDMRLMEEAQACAAEVKNNTAVFSGRIHRQIEGMENRPKFEKALPDLTEKQAAFTSSNREGCEAEFSDEEIRRKLLDNQRKIQALSMAPERNIQPGHSLTNHLREITEEVLEFMSSGVVSTRFRHVVEELDHRSKLPTFELPPRPQIFFGRRKEMEACISALLAHDSAHLSSTGPGGIGKTTLAIAVLHDTTVMRKFGSGRMFLSLDGVTSLDGFLSCLQRVLHLGEAENPRQMIVEYFASLHEHFLIVLDNFESLWDTEEQNEVESILGEVALSNYLSILVTMRGNLRPTGVVWSSPETGSLQPIGLEDAYQIFDKISRRSERTNAVDTLLGMLDGLPLVITLIAYQGQILAIEDLLEVYQKEAARLLRRGRGRRQTSLEVSIEVSLKSLTMQDHPEALKLLSILCLLPDGMKYIALSLAVPSLELPGEASRTLQQVALVTENPDRLKVLAPIREYILMQYLPDVFHLVQVRHYYIRLAFQTTNVGRAPLPETVAVVLPEIGNMTAVLLHAWQTLVMDDDIDVLLDATRQAARFSQVTSSGDTQRLLSCAKQTLRAIGAQLSSAKCGWSLGEVLRMKYRYEDAIATFEEARILFDANDDRLGLAQCRKSIGHVQLMEDRHDEAIVNLQEAMTVYRELGDEDGVAECAIRIGDVLQIQHQHKKALAQLETAKAIFDAIGNRLGTAHCAQSIGDVLRMDNRYEEAVQRFEEARTIFEALDNPRGAAQCILRIGDILRILHRYSDATARLEQAKNMFEVIHHRHGIAQCLQLLGSVLLMQGRYDDAVADVAQAKEEFEGTSDRLGAAQCVLMLGNILRMQNRWTEAVTKFNEARAVFEVIGDRLGVARCIKGVGDVLVIQHRLEEALETLEEARNAFEIAGDQLGLGQCVQSLSDVLRKQGRYEEAILRLQEATAIFSGADDRLGYALSVLRLGEIYRMQNRYDDAMARVQEAKAVFELLGHQLGTAQCIKIVGDIFRMQNRWDEAVPMLQKADTMFEELGDRLGAAQCKSALGGVFGLQNRYQEAAAVLQVGKAQFEPMGHQSGAAQCMRSLGDVLHMQDRNDEAIETLQKAKALFDSLHEQFDAGQCLQILGKVLRFTRRWEEGASALEEAITIFRQQHHQVGVAMCKQEIASVRLGQGRAEVAMAELAEASTIFKAFDDGLGIARCIGTFGDLCIVVSPP
ncbi:TPR-like protein [Dacryopinax primogenitus]|uniref:TPR-like protein n=1 Tax=Dacryopinax primogenitus (strain DJM 731) TaxID=1858805 RepID=M5G3G3_DACPD|nr:TPR-like protein [Dacryopinax primogenitus]EJU02760.1 TPR-like protein [Dacryopinax primogenitus]